MVKGIPVSDGYGIGKALIVKNMSLSYDNKTIDDIEGEISKYKNATKILVERTERMTGIMKSSQGEKNAEILNSQIIVAKDILLQQEIEDRIKEGKCSEWAVDEVCEKFSCMLSDSNDELIRQRATDIRDIKNRLIRILLDIPEVDIADVQKGTVLVVDDLTPSMMSGIIKENIEAIIMESGERMSHSAIIARTLEVPAVFGVYNATTIVQNGDLIAVDGCYGAIKINPDAVTIDEYNEKKAIFLKEKNEVLAYIGKPTLTGDGNQVKIVGNIGDVVDAHKVLEYDGEGVGLFRSELLFMNKASMPTEDEQFDAYKKVAKLMRDKPVVIRTLDIGGDKELGYLKMQKEENPYLGFRGIRYWLSKEEIYKPQLKAILRASAFGNIKIMLPLVTNIEELRMAKELIEKTKKELYLEQKSYNKNIEVGVMIETPAACFIADLLAKEADFFSIGTNDLTQYTMAADRGNSNVAYLYSAYQPSVIRAIKCIIDEAKAHGIKATMCGEAAADKLLVPLLIALGLDEFSVSANNTLKLRATIAKWDKKEADMVAKKVLELSTCEEVEAYLKTVAK